jgi:signal transduction histidine kinase
MPVTLTCPNCSKVIREDDHLCPGCGLNLTLAILMAEQTLAASPVIPSGAPITPELLVPRLGDFLLEKGVLSAGDLQYALLYQHSRAETGEIRLLGQALLELGLVDRETLDQVITEQILHLQAALQDSNRKLENRVQERTLDLQKALNKLTELNQLKSSFISSISHELRTPLTHIKGYLDLLADGSLGELNSAQSDAVQVLLRAENRLTQLIDNLIRFSMAARGELSLNMTPVDLALVANQLLGSLRKQASSRQVILEFMIDVPLPTVLADKEKMSWVLLQLLDNAVKFTPANGKVTLRMTSDGSIVTVSISDTGIGISEDNLKEIFQPFHQLDGSDTRRYGGTGLGLALVQRIIDAHGSNIHVRSAIGEGSCFEFHLPATTPEYTAYA